MTTNPVHVGAITNMSLIGNKIREIRLENGLTQEELADRSELSKGFISQLEQGKTSPSIATLQDILEVLGTNLADFFHEGQEEQYVFTKDEFFEKIDLEKKVKISWIVPNAQKYEMEPILLELEPGGSYDEEPHAGEEFGYLLEGEIILKIGKKKFKVAKGQTFYYNANKNHGLENQTKKRAVVLWISTPPMF
ncbi:MAG: helix-turn-helix domain-containing protein [Candidatus Izemoplasmatales bacterium]|nr:helix-turn-helix domain-containing protein [Candidatus Izemoplasmatales bacterium]